MTFSQPALSHQHQHATTLLVLCCQVIKIEMLLPEAAAAPTGCFDEESGAGGSECFSATNKHMKPDVISIFTIVK